MREIIEINSILKDFYDVSGIRISIHDTEFNEIYSYPQELEPGNRIRSFLTIVSRNFIKPDVIILNPKKQ